MSTSPITKNITNNREQHIGRLLQRAYRDFNRRAVAKLEQAGYHGLTLLQAEVISHIDTNGTRVVNIARKMGVTKQSSGEVVQQLEKLGYVERVTDPQDARAMVIQFTSLGEELLVKTDTVKKELEQECISSLGKFNFKAFKKSLENIIDD